MQVVSFFPHLVKSAVTRRARMFFLAVLACLFVAVGAGCKGKKKVVEPPVVTQPTAAQAQLAKLKAELEAMLTDKVTPLEQRERRLAEIKALNIQDAEIQDLIRRVEEALLNERRQMEELRRREEAAQSSANAKAQLASMFQSIATASSVSVADGRIQEALTMFASAQTPVLIVIHKTNGQKDYDRPTTIGKYLSYLKDTRQNLNEVGEIVYDASGKISELELVKR